MQRRIINFLEDIKMRDLGRFTFLDALGGQARIFNW